MRAHLIASGVCDAAVVGGADSLCRMTLHGFASLDLISPVPCRPCDAGARRHLDRRGGGLRAAGARPVDDAAVALLGCGTSSDGYHMSAPHPKRPGAVAAMRAALRARACARRRSTTSTCTAPAPRPTTRSEDMAVRGGLRRGDAVQFDQGLDGPHARRGRDRWRR